MADGAVVVASPTFSDDLFWCHQCRTEVHPSIPDYICPQCSGGFVEPVQESHRSGTGRLAGTGLFSAGHVDDGLFIPGDDDELDDDDDDDEGPGAHMAYADFSRLLRTLIRSMPAGYDDDDRMPPRVRRQSRGERQPRSGSGSTASTPGANTQTVTAPLGDSNEIPDQVPDNDAAAAAQAAEAAAGGGEGEQQQQQQGESRRGGMRNRGGRRRRRGYAAGFLPLEDILEQMFATSFGGGFGQGGSYFVSGNPGDYAFGPRGLDDIITQLLNQYEGGGAAPAKEEEIDALEDQPITEKDAAMQCPVCFDEFEVGKVAKRLACRHAFHEDCIVPWLKIHGTCPVCRSDMQGQAPQDSPDATPGTTVPSNPEVPGTSGTQQSRPAQQPRSQRPDPTNRPTNPTFTFRAALRPNIYMSPNAGGGLRHRQQQQSRTSSNSTAPGRNNNPDRSRGSGGGAGGSSSSSSYLDQVD